MRLILLSLFNILLVSCSSMHVERKTQLGFDSLFFAIVDNRTSITLEPNESKVGRVLVGLVSGGPIGAIATANTEEDFSHPKAYEYVLHTNLNESKTIISRSIVDIGSCVEVISPDESVIEVLRVVLQENCKNSYNKVMHPENG